MVLYIITVHIYHQVDLGFVRLIDQSLEIVSNPLLQSFRAASLGTYAVYEEVCQAFPSLFALFPSLSYEPIYNYYTLSQYIYYF